MKAASIPNRTIELASSAIMKSNGIEVVQGLGELLGPGKLKVSRAGEKVELVELKEAAGVSFDDFVKVVADRQEVWGLHREGWALAAQRAARQDRSFRGRRGARAPRPCRR